MASRFETCLRDAAAAITQLRHALDRDDRSGALAATCTLRRCLGALDIAAAGSDRAVLADITARSTPLLARAPVVTDHAWKQHARRA